MSAMIVAVDVPAVAGAHGKRAKTLWRGQRRKLVKKLLHTLYAIQHSDAKAELASGKISVSPLLFVNARGSYTANAFSHLVSRCLECMGQVG